MPGGVYLTSTSERVLREENSKRSSCIYRLEVTGKKVPKGEDVMILFKDFDAEGVSANGFGAISPDGRKPHDRESPGEAIMLKGRKKLGPSASRIQ